METNPLFIIFYSLIPAAGMVAGGFLSIVYQPKRKLISSTQHFAAGVVFAAVGFELLPKIIGHSKVMVSIGFLLGVAFMLGVKWFTGKIEATSKDTQAYPVGLALAVAIAVFIDGLLIGVSFLAGHQSGLILTIALSIEIFFLGLATLGALSQRNTSRDASFITMAALAVVIPVGVSIGAVLFSRLPSEWITEALAFGVAAFLYLVTEELLLEAYQTRDTLWTASLFFVGFWLILLFQV